MGKWKIVQPAAGYNYVRNPSAEGTASFAAEVGGAVTRVTTYAAYGEYCYKIVPGGANRGIDLTCATVAAAMGVTFAARGVSGVLTANAGGGAGTMVPVQALGDGWTLYVSGALAGAGTSLVILNSSNETWYLDGVLAYNRLNAHVPTYLDGDQEGCSWVGTRHDSASSRPASIRAGGAILDLADDLYTSVNFPTGGLSAVQNIVSARPLRAGGSVDASRVTATFFVLPAHITAASAVTLNARQMALADLLMPDRVPLGDDGRPQPVRLQYWGAARVLELSGSYDGGLDGKQLGYQMRIAPAFRAANDPYWHEVITRCTTLSTADTDTVRLMIRQLRTGRWDPLGPPSAVTVDPTIYAILASAQDAGHIYVGGIFVDLDGQAALDRLAVYDKVAGTWGALAATPADNAVRCMLLDHAGNLWIGGDFHNVNGVACAHIAVRSPAGVWTQPDGGVDDIVWALTIDETGYIYAGGAFHNAGGHAALHVAQYAGAAGWGPVGAGLDGPVYALAWTDYQDRLYAGGNFTNYLQYYTYGTVPGPWTTLPNGSPNTIVWGMAAIRSNAIAFGGSFTTVGGLDSDYLALYFEDGELWPFPVGPDALVWALSYDKHANVLYLGGNFTTIGDLTLGAHIARLRVAYPFIFEALPVVFALDVVPQCLNISATSRDARVEGDVFFGFNGVGTATFPGEATVTLPAVTGGAESRPVVTLRRSGAGAATISYIENLTTGKRILLEDEFLDGEELIVDLVDLTIQSSYGGVLRPLAPKPGSQFASWSLLPGGNDIYVRVVADVAVTVTGTLVYRQNFHSFAAGDN